MPFATLNENIVYLGLLADEDIELDSASLELSALDHEGLDLEPYLKQLGDITRALTAARDAHDRGEHLTGAVQGALLSSVIAGQFGYAGDSETYDAPLNADMIRVLDRRRGLPVSLAILYVAAARRVGWNADALNTPSHVLVSIGPKDAAALIDPFHGGALVPPERLMALIERAVGASHVPAQSHVKPMSNRKTLVRLLRNQAIRAEQDGDPARAVTVYRRMTIVAPEHGQGWWDLARLQLVHGAVDEARASLSAMLEVTRDPEQRRHVVQALERLAASRTA